MSRSSRTPSRAVALLPLMALLLFGSCAYFNELYNAKRAFGEAERAEARGDLSTARQRYSVAVEKAAKSIRRSPDGRWADDAFFLIGRSHFSLGEHAKARAALLRALDATDDGRIRALSLTYLGAAELRLDRPEAALARLEEALSPRVRSDETEPVARLWRARAQFALGRPATAWEDLDVTVRSGGVIAREALLEQLGRAIEADQPDRAAAAVEGLARMDEARSEVDSIQALGLAAARQWGPVAARALLLPLAEAPWPGTTRDSIVLFRGRIALEAGDTASAIEDARAVFSAGSGTMAERARVLLARWELTRVEDVSDLEPIRSLLLPALAQQEARELVQTMKTLDVLLERARSARQPLALFAAAELARDRLGARTLARRLFVAAVDMAPQTSYAGKALLAALALQPPPAERSALEQRARSMGENFYLRVDAGEEAGEGEFQTVEERLDRVLSTMVSAAAREAERRDALVVQTITELDSLREAAALDSIAVQCGLLIDSLAVAGERGDSARAACVRSDTLRLDSLVQGLIRLPGDSATPGEPMDPDTTVPDTFPTSLGPGAAAPGHPIWSLLSPAR